MKRPSVPRKTANLSKSIHQQLNAYAIAAGAAGVSLLVLAQPADAKIIYTPAHVVIGRTFPLDLNHDGIIDFWIVDGFNESHAKHGLSVCQVMSSYHGPFCRNSPTNAIRAVESVDSEFAAALRPGAKIQRGDRFAYVLRMGGLEAFDKTTHVWYGPWVNGGNGVKNRYLGLKFKIKGRYHFGWARLTVTTTSDDFRAVLTGYAYETIPGKSIKAGQTKGPDDIVEGPDAAPTAEPATLGRLALGAQGPALWRRRESEDIAIENN
jgi:hypothetical protein